MKNRKQLQSSIQNLTKIREIIEISKFDTMQKLQRAIKTSDTFIEFAFYAKNLINFVSEKYKISGQAFKDKENRTLWVYATSEKEIMSSIDIKFQKMIDEGFNKSKDYIIALGEEAVNHSEKMGLRSVYKNRTLDDVEDKVASIINSMYLLKHVSFVKFIVNSPKVIDSPITILPISKLNIQSKDSLLDFNKKYSIYPSITESLKSLTQTYIYQMSSGLLKEAKYYHLKEKLVKNEESLKSIDDKVDRLKKDIIKINRKEETEEMILVSQIAKRGGKNE